MKVIQKEKGSVFCNEGAWNSLTEQLKTSNFSKTFVLCDENTIHHCLSLFLNRIIVELEPEILVIPVGEQHKNISTCSKLWEELSNRGADRNSLLINLGGGVVTDLGGFVASTFKRGIEFINVPTSLLAMVDASVGGKNGVDLGPIKNQIGVIRNPLLVVIETDFLQTLPSEEITSGMAEMLKHGLISSEEYWQEVLVFDDQSKCSMEDLIWKSVLIKNEVVTEDPLEMGRRKTLNYGHTLGHAIESYCLESETKKTILHGHAVAIGMVLATYISYKSHSFPEETLAQLIKVVKDKFEAIQFNEEDIDSIIQLLIYDKKNRNGKVLFVLLENIGKPVYNCEVSNQLILESFDFYHHI